MNGKSLKLGLIGKDVSKSNSGKIHTFILGKLGYGCEFTRVSVGQEGFLEKAKELYLFLILVNLKCLEARIMIKFTKYFWKYGY